MARFKDFGYPVDADVAEKISFKIYGEEFFCYPVMQGATLLKFVKSSSSDNIGESAEAVMEFFEKVLVPESYERFEALADDPEKIVPVEVLADIVGWVMEEYSNRPAKGPEHLPSGD